MTPRSHSISAAGKVARRSMSEHIDDDGEVSRAGPRVVAGHLLRSEGVEVTAHTFNGLGDFTGVPLRRALEEHVLKKMKDTVLAL